MYGAERSHGFCSDFAAVNCGGFTPYNSIGRTASQSTRINARVSFGFISEKSALARPQARRARQSPNRFSDLHAHQKRPESADSRHQVLRVESERDIPLAADPHRPGTRSPGSARGTRYFGPGSPAL